MSDVGGTASFGDSSLIDTIEIDRGLAACERYRKSIVIIHILQMELERRGLLKREEPTEVFPNFNNSADGINVEMLRVQFRALASIHLAKSFNEGKKQLLVDIERVSGAVMCEPFLGVLHLYSNSTYSLAEQPSQQAHSRLAAHLSL